MIVLFGNRKGGCGKSQTVINLAGVIANKGLSVCIVDADDQATVVRHMRRREKTNEIRISKGQVELPFIKTEQYNSDAKLVRELNQLKALFDYVLVDTGGYENDAFKSSVSACNVLYMPFQACQSDIEQILPTLKIVKDIESYTQMHRDENFQIDTRLIVTKVDHHSTDMLIEARKTCERLLDQVSISNCVIKETKQIRQCQQSGTTLSDKVFTGDKAHKKRAMFELLFDEIVGINDVKYKRHSSEQSSNLETNVA